MIRYHYTLLLLLLIGLLIPACSPSPGKTNTPVSNSEIMYTPSVTLPATVPELIIVLHGNDPEAKVMAAVGLGNMGKAAELAVPALAKSLFDSDAELRRRAAEALGKIGPGSRSAIPQLIVVLLKDSFVHTRAEAAIALGKIGDAVAVPALAFALDDEEHNVQIDSAKSIALLTGQKFTDMNGPGYLLDENKNPILVLEAKEWWNSQGNSQTWLPTK